MAKKLSDLQNVIENKAPEFDTFLGNVLNSGVYDFLHHLSDIDKVYIFSGIIRNFFLGTKEVRDLDLMFDSSYNLEEILKKNAYQYRKNSFGGYKILIDDTWVDLWYLKDTWALNNYQKVLELDIEKYIPNTAFFNFSSILFDFENKEFIYTKAFLRFLRDKKIDFVFKPNANYALCVINSIYYQEKLNMDFTPRMKIYLKQLDSRYNQDYEDAQIKHFGKVIFTRSDIQNRIKLL